MNDCDSERVGYVDPPHPGDLIRESMEEIDANIRCDDRRAGFRWLERNV